ncbi:UvrD-helicase domain-containing protein [Tahibacter harae]|uniref:RecBCD enzyme subunit RecB n=1 Tax=Tahibacter harae TaxID=2963937 RepID=A0ABT1QPV5_9GAMM|nr:UvrD-helicase domain-containing protein [Tahibacter harae]MCQ4164324.1 UvrD-helicase domain-containing protein [Tahibacter harae]
MTEPRRPRSWRDLELGPGGRSLIEASAGTGKTWTIAVLYLRLLLEGEAPYLPRQIVVSTFTDAAAQELRERLRARLAWAQGQTEAFLRGMPVQDGDDAQWLRRRWQDSPAQAQTDLLRLRLAQAELDLAPVGTLHSLCRRILADFPVESGSAFAAGELIAESGVLELLVDDLWRDLMQREAPLDQGDLLWVREGRANLRRALQAVLAPGVAVRSADPAAPLTAQERAALLQDAHAVIAVPERFKLSGARNSKLLQALRELAAADEADALAAFDAAGVREHEGQLDKQFKKDALGDALLLARLERIFAALRRLDEARDASKAAALERYRRQLLQRRHDQLLREARLTFNMLIEGAALALRDPASPLAARLREQWPVALVDEFQDTDAQQYAILDAIYRDAQRTPRGRLIMIGDPKQAIYRFRGGDIHTYLKAAQTADEVLELAVNRRSSHAYVTALNALYELAGPALSQDPQHPIRYAPVTAAGREDVYAAPDGSAVSAALVLHYQAEAPSGQEERRRHALEACARQIAGLLQSGYRLGDAPLAPGDIAVLLPKNQQVEQLRELLLRRGVPCVGAGKRSVFETVLARELQLMLYAVEHNSDDSALRAALATGFGRCGYADLCRLREDTDEWQQLRQRFSGLRREWQRHGVLSVVLELSDDLARGLALASERERALTDLRHLGELLQAQSEVSAGAEQLLAWFAQQRDAPTEGDEAANEHQLRLESDARRVRLLTLHASKGLEFPVVFLPLMWDHSGKIPALPLTWDAASGLRLAELAGAGQARAQQQVREEDQEERFRVLYVALTRARHACHVYALSPQRPRDARANAPAPADPERSALDATVARLQQALAGRPLQHPHLAWREDGWDWPEARYQAAEAPAQPLHARQEPPRPALEQTYSFTALVAGRGRGAQEESAAEDEGGSAEALPQPPLFAAVPAPPPDPRILELSHLRGPEFGNAVHAVFERRRPGQPLADQLELVERSLREQAAKPAGEGGAAAIAALVQRCIDLPLVGGASLASLAPAQLRAEMGFQFVLDNVSPRALREACQRHGAGALLPEHLPPTALQGLMSGKIDLVFEHDGRFHVLDYKTNYLGDALHDYAPQRLEAAMQEHHYGFQALLYTVAVERYLRQRLPGYRRAQHLGEAIYLFVRASGLDAASGIWRHRFDGALLDAVDHALGAPRRGAAA